VTLRQHIAEVVLEAIIRAATWLFRAQELPPMPVLPKTWEELSAAQPTWRETPKPRLKANEFQLLVLLRTDGLLAYALGVSPVPGHRIDTRYWN
jgi:hypothetical protein